MSVRWDPGQYQRFGDERGRPFVELLLRVDAARAPDAGDPSYVVDLGCGPGPLTRLLADRWPTAMVRGVDSSPDMVASAQEQAIEGRLTFAVGDIATWQSDRPVDVLLANAALHWVPGHVDLFRRFTEMLTPNGVFAFQVPDNFTEPSHTLLRDLRLSPRWRDRLGEGADRGVGVERPERYLQALVAAGLDADVWQTSYLHVLGGDDAVLEWVKGTALRPVLSVLDDADREEFLKEYGAALRAAYPPEPHGTVFPFRRTFAVARHSWRT
ncbi:MAG TPA: methyltransferase domain-containing protein [Mycobacteriales bacterium]|nr:methyltransferase domain-containing protein [Mycobacteriales bacterium]